MTPTPTPRPTPETDNLILSCGGWGPTNHEWREHARDLERERDEAREQIEAMREAIREVFNSFADEDSAWLLDDLQTAALTKLQPFIKP